MRGKHAALLPNNFHGLIQPQQGHSKIIYGTETHNTNFGATKRRPAMQSNTELYPSKPTGFQWTYTLSNSIQDCTAGHSLAILKVTKEASTSTVSHVRYSVALKRGYRLLGRQQC